MQPLAFARIQAGNVYRAIRHPSPAGRLAQWQEMLTDPEQKIVSPRQIYTGHTVREFLSMENCTLVATGKP